MSVASHELSGFDNPSDKGAPQTEQHYGSAAQVFGVLTDKLLKTKASVHGSNINLNGIRRSWNGYDSRRVRVGKSPKTRSAASLKTRSAASSLSRQRFERQRRSCSSSTSSEYNMPTGIPGSAHSDELKFRSDFQQCFRQFPLENVFKRPWGTYGPPVNTLADKPTSQQLETLFYDDIESLFLAPSPERDPSPQSPTENPSKTTLCDFSLPVHPDGSPIAELDAIDTSWSSVRAEEIALANRRAIANKLPAIQAENQRKPTSDRFTKRLSSLRLLRWTGRASTKPQKTREQGSTARDSSPYSKTTSPKVSAPRNLKATKQDLLPCHHIFPRHGIGTQTIITTNPPRTPIKPDNFACTDEEHTPRSTEPRSKPGQIPTTVGGCCIFIASQAQ